MVPVLPFSALFAAIVSAQQTECYTRSGLFLGLAECVPPKPPELTLVVIPTPTDEEFINHDVWRPRWECRFPPRLPPYATVNPSLSPKPEMSCSEYYRLRAPR